MGFMDVLNVLATNNYFVGALLISITFIIVILLLYYSRKYIYRKIKVRKGLTSYFLMKFENPIIILAIVLSAEIIINMMLSQRQPLIITIERVNTTLLIIAVTYILMLIMDLFIQRWSNGLDTVRRSRAHQEVVPLIRSVKNILMSILAILLILQAWGVRTTGIAASIGIIGVVLGFIYKETFSNIISGISLIMDDSFKKGDLIELQDGEIGYIEEINLRSTKIRNFNAEEVIVPNNLLSNMKIKNYAHPTKSIRLRVDFSVTYGSDPDKVSKVVMNLLKSSRDVLKFPPPKVFFNRMADYSLSYSALFYINDYNKMYKIKSDMTASIYKELYKNKIKIPFPTRTIYMEQSKDSKSAKGGQQ